MMMMKRVKEREVKRCGSGCVRVKGFILVSFVMLPQ